MMLLNMAFYVKAKTTFMGVLLNNYSCFAIASTSFLSELIKMIVSGDDGAGNDGSYY